MTPIKHNHPDAGFTLIELMIAVAIFGIVLGAASTVFTSNAKSYKSQEITLELNQELRAALNIMTTEIRMAGYDPNGTVTPGITVDSNVDESYSSGDDSIRFTMDLDGDELLGDSGGDAAEDVNYFVDDSGTLIRRINDGAGNFEESTIGENITDLTFTYYDANNNTITSSGNVRSVLISLTGQSSVPDPYLRAVKTRTETALVRIRNIGLRNYTTPS
jgi:type IV pilus assembly protein PilW